MDRFLGMEMYLALLYDMELQFARNCLCENGPVVILSFYHGGIIMGTELSDLGMQPILQF